MINKFFMIVGRTSNGVGLNWVMLYNLRRVIIVNLFFLIELHFLYEVYAETYLPVEF
jgi:hypothetical protein